MDAEPRAPVSPTTKANLILDTRFFYNRLTHLTPTLLPPIILTFAIITTNKILETSKSLETLGILTLASPTCLNPIFYQIQEPIYYLLLLYSLQNYLLSNPQPDDTAGGGSFGSCRRKFFDENYTIYGSHYLRQSINTKQHLYVDIIRPISSSREYSQVDEVQCHEALPQALLPVRHHFFCLILFLLL